MNPSTTMRAGRQRKTNWLPLLVFLFVVSYGLQTTLIVLQDRTIDAQADVIHALFKENNLRAALAAQKARAAAAKVHGAQGRAAKRTSDKDSAASAAPSSQKQTDGGAARIPSSQKKLGGRTKGARNQQNAGKRSPFSRPPAETTDPSDMRRTLFSI